MTEPRTDPRAIRTATDNYRSAYYHAEIRRKLAQEALERLAALHGLNDPAASKRQRENRWEKLDKTLTEIHTAVRIQVYGTGETQPEIQRNISDDGSFRNGDRAYGERFTG